MFRRSDTPPEDDPRAPCDAYWAVADVLPPHHLVANAPPPTGRKLIVTGRRDRISTYWEMDPYTARFVFDELRDQGANVDVTSANYDNR